MAQIMDVEYKSGLVLDSVTVEDDGNWYECVNVVRCRDCIHSRLSRRFLQGYECDIFKGSALTGDWYCASGEKKETEK